MEGDALTVGKLLLCICQTTDERVFQQYYIQYLRENNIQQRTSYAIKFRRELYSFWCMFLVHTLAPPPSLPKLGKQKRYQVIVMDPPWANQSFAYYSTNACYPRMSQKELLALPVQELADTNCICLMWTISSYLDAGLELLRHWHFQQKGWAYIWCKTTKNGRPVGGLRTCYYPEKCCEIVLVGVRGHLDKKKTRGACKQTDIIISVRREHSRKPEEFWHSVNHWLPATEFPNRLEMFAREARPGWDVWGNQVNKF